MPQSVKFGGVVVPLLSPFGEAEQLDRDALEKQFNSLMSHPIHGMYLCGGTGDAEKLLPDERREICDMLVPRLVAAGKTAIVHVGQTNLRTAVSLAQHAAKAGAHAIASIPPRAPWEGAKIFYQELAAVGIPVFVYYIPGVTGITADINNIASLLEIKGVVGIKVSDWNCFLISQIKQAYPEKIVFTGYDEMLFSGLAAGADGSIGTWANLFPSLYTKMFALTTAARWSEAHTLSQAFSAFLAQCWQYGALPSFEAIMQARGVPPCFRQPPSWGGGLFPPCSVEQLSRSASELEALALST